MCAPLSLLGKVSVETSSLQRMHMQQWNNSWTCYYLCRQYSIRKGRAVAQAVSSWLPTVAARVRVRDSI
jgi:hypothetical protein